MQTSSSGRRAFQLTVKHSQRRTFVFLSLIAFMSATGAILLALAPQPLAPDLPQSLIAVDSPDPMSAVFSTQPAAETTGWKYIYIRQSRSISGDANSLLQRGEPLGDHFVICNGRGATDGEIQMTPRWVSQRSALPPAGAATIDPQCISICLIGDLDQHTPTATQLRRLTRLVATLQARLDIPARNVVVESRPNTPAAAGKLFPVAEFRSQIRP